MLVTTSGLTVSCSKEFINEEAPYTIDSESYFNSEADYNKALIGAYDMLQSSYINVMLGDIASDKMSHASITDFAKPHAPASLSALNQVLSLGCLRKFT